MNREYAERSGADWVILSAKYGFLRPDDIVPAPYNVTLKRRSTNPVDVTTLRRQVHDLGLESYDEVIGLGGKEYRAAIEAAFAGSAVALRFPFAGLRIGTAMAAIKKATA